MFFKKYIYTQIYTIILIILYHMEKSKVFKVKPESMRAGNVKSESM